MLAYFLGWVLLEGSERSVSIAGTRSIKVELASASAPSLREVPRVRKRGTYFVFIFNLKEAAINLQPSEHREEREAYCESQYEHFMRQCAPTCTERECARARVFECVRILADLKMSNSVYAHRQ